MSIPKLGKSFQLKTFLTFFLLVVVSACIVLAIFLPPPRQRHDIEKFTPEQKSLLEKLKSQAEMAGMGKEELGKIAKFEVGICYNVDCLESALEIMSAINLREDPCSSNKWLEFVCSRRISGSGTDIYAQLAQAEVNSIRDTLDLLREEERTDASEFLLEEAKTYFRQCTNRSGDNDQQDIRDILEVTREYGGWPIFTNSTPPRDYPWIDFVADQNRLQKSEGFTPLFLEVSIDASETGTKIQLDVGRLTFNNSDYQSESQYQSIIRRMVHRGRLAEAPVLDQLESAFEFLQKLANSILVLSSGPDDETPQQVELPLEGLQAVTDEFFEFGGVASFSFNWTQFFGRVFSRTKLKVGTDPLFQRISLPIVPIMRILGEVGLEMNSTQGRRNVVNVLQLNLVRMLLQETSSPPMKLEASELKNEFEKRTHICLKRVMTTFGYSLGKTYLNRYYNPMVKPHVSLIMENVQQSYMELLESPPWLRNSSMMRTSTKEFLQDKVKSIQLIVAQPDWMNEPGKLEEFFEGLKVDTRENSSYIRNFLEVSSWQVAKKRIWESELFEKYQRKEIGLFETEWNFYLGQTDASYLIPTNKVYILAGLLQKPIYGMNRPGFMNYGTIATLLGHEIAHSIIDGRQFDKFGDNSTEHWDPISIQIFQQWVADTAQFYNSIPLQVHNLTEQDRPLESTTSEDLSDVLGVHVAFLAYRRFLKALAEAGDKEKVLPGLGSFSPEQLFFMKYGNMWCENPEAQFILRQYYSTDEHSPPSRRADLPLRQLEHFKKFFNCN